MTWSVHDDDLGMAVANSLAAVRAGGKQVECTVNGLANGQETLPGGSCHEPENQEGQLRVQRRALTTKL